MFLFYVLSFFKKGDVIQGGTLFKRGHVLRKYGKYFFESRTVVNTSGPSEGLKIRGEGVSK